MQTMCETQRTDGEAIVTIGTNGQEVPPALQIGPGTRQDGETERISPANTTRSVGRTNSQDEVQTGDHPDIADAEPHSQTQSSGVWGMFQPTDNVNMWNIDHDLLQGYLSLIHI